MANVALMVFKTLLRLTSAELTVFCTFCSYLFIYSILIHLDSFLLLLYNFFLVFNAAISQFETDLITYLSIYLITYLSIWLLIHPSIHPSNLGVAEICGEVAELGTLVQEGEVLLDYREQRDDGRLHALAAQDVAVLGHVPGWVEHVLQVPK